MPGAEDRPCVVPTLTGTHGGRTCPAVPFTLAPTPKAGYLSLGGLFPSWAQAEGRDLMSIDSPTLSYPGDKLINQNIPWLGPAPSPMLSFDS